jgi:polyphosphate kinase
MVSTADFLNSDFPKAISCNEDFSGPSRFLNRELSWLAFNWRVLEEANNSNVPLLERIRFLSISATNLDEFYSVRVAGLRELAHAGSNAAAIDGSTPSNQLLLIEVDTRKLMQEQQSVLTQLRDEMAKNDIHILTAGQAETDYDYLQQVFLRDVFPVVSPLAIDPAHPFPFIPNTGFALALQLERISDKRSLRALVPIPHLVQRFIQLPGEGYRYLPLEELILMQLEQIFPGYKLNSSCAFSILRDSDLEVEDEAEDLVREFEVALKRRRRGDVIRLKITKNAPMYLRNAIMAELVVTETEVVEIDGMMGLSNLHELVIEDRPKLLFPKFTPRVPERFSDHDGDMFAAIRQKDMLLQHPYETFDMVVRFLQQAARDPNVLAIKQTLYRTSKRSPIVEALCEAAEAGKSVTALVELKARFDEAANIRQSRRLERAGAHVVYGFMNLKTHAKITTVVRREGDRLITYTHYGTGNYHPITARVYTDLSLFTCDAALGRDATKVFNYLSGYAQPNTLENISISPLSLKSTLLTQIEIEAENAKKSKPAAIWAKVNSIIDADVIDALYAASQTGVKISLVVRGICGLRPGVKGLSENIRVKSIVGRFLEHSRIVCFANSQDLPSLKARVYISSADWMDRNLKRRVETLVEIKNATVKAQIVSQVMAANLADVAQSWIMKPDGSYVRATGPKQSFAFSCHRFFTENPSLSGRGSAGAGDVPKLTHSDVSQALPNS